MLVELPGQHHSESCSQKPEHAELPKPRERPLAIAWTDQGGQRQQKRPKQQQDGNKRKAEGIRRAQPRSRIAERRQKRAFQEKTKLPAQRISQRPEQAGRRA